jgi:hypothetical protein
MHAVVVTVTISDHEVAESHLRDDPSGADQRTGRLASTLPRPKVARASSSGGTRLPRGRASTVSVETCARFAHRRSTRGVRSLEPQLDDIDANWRERIDGP